MKRTLLLICLALVAIPSAGLAKGEWDRIRQKQGEYLFTMSAVGGAEFFTAGMYIDPSSRFPLPSPVVYWTQDGGKMLKTVMGNLPASMTSGLPQEIHFFDTMNGWISMGEKVYRTTKRGAVWLGTDVGTAVNDIHFVTGAIGVAAGDGGTILRTVDGGETWLPVTSGTNADLKCQFWLDGKRAFAAGHRVEESEDNEGNVTSTWHEGVVLVTGDGGQTWKKGYESSGVALCPLYFLPDGQNGWLAVTEPGQGDEARTKARLFRSTDGGMSFVDTGLDTQVGTMNFMMSVPLEVSYFTAMRWDDEFRGHLAGSVFVVELSSGMGGGGGKIYRTADFLTMDGGKTWEKTDLGQVTVNITGGSMPSSDGQTLDGFMPSLFEGTMVGENGSVWAYGYSCASHVDCGTGYVCNADSRCEPLPAPPDPCADGACGPDGKAASEHAEGVVVPGTDAAAACAEGTCGGGSGGGDCAASPGTKDGGPLSLALLMLGLAVALRRASARKGA